jgi:hypothetical protein
MIIIIIMIIITIIIIILKLRASSRSEARPLAQRQDDHNNNKHNTNDTSKKLRTSSRLEPRPWHRLMMARHFICGERDKIMMACLKDAFFFFFLGCVSKSTSALPLDLPVARWRASDSLS